MLAWLRPGHQKRRSWRDLLWRQPPTSVLVREADDLARRGRLGEATRLLTVAAAEASPDERRPVLEELAVVAAESGRHAVSTQAIIDLDQLDDDGADRPSSTWLALANVALARGNHQHADRAARSALATDPTNNGAWATLAAGFAGLGWFDESRRCLDRVDRAELTPRQRRRIGQAVNRWAMTGSGRVVAIAVSLLIVAMSALAEPLNLTTIDPGLLVTAALGMSAMMAAVLPLIRRWFLLRRLVQEVGGAEATGMAAEAWGLRPAFHRSS